MFVLKSYFETYGTILIRHNERRRLEMSEGTPIVIIAIALILVAVALIALRNRGKLKQPILRNKKTFLPLSTIGLVPALIGAFFMFDGDILGKNTTGIATVIGIVGIGLIATSNFTLLKR
jgi:amino acid transporter